MATCTALMCSETYIINTITDTSTQCVKNIFGGKNCMYAAMASEACTGLALQAFSAMICLAPSSLSGPLAFVAAPVMCLGGTVLEVGACCLCLHQTTTKDEDLAQEVAHEAQKNKEKLAVYSKEVESLRNKIETFRDLNAILTDREAMSARIDKQQNGIDKLRPQVISNEEKASILKDNASYSLNYGSAEQYSSALQETQDFIALIEELKHKYNHDIDSDKETI